MAPSIKRARNLNHRHRRVPGRNLDQTSHDLIFDGPWEELVIRFDKERGGFTVCTARGANTEELRDSAKHRLP